MLKERKDLENVDSLCVVEYIRSTIEILMKMKIDD